MTKVEIGNATLYLGDCFEVLPELERGSVDAVITDPPYAAAAATIVTGRARDTWGRNWGDMSLVQMLGRQILEAPCIAAEHCVYWFCDHLAHAALLPQMFRRYHLLQTIVWDKDNLGMGACYRKQTELILYGRTQEGPSVEGTARDLIRLRPNYSAREHPAEKPAELMSQIVRACPSWRCALDPFMGVGSTGVATVADGRRFIGVEIEERYFDIACKRIEAAQMDRSRLQAFDLVSSEGE